MLSKSSDKIADIEQGLMKNEGWRLGRLNTAKVSKVMEKSTGVDGSLTGDKDEGVKLLAEDEPGQVNRIVNGKGENSVNSNLTTQNLIALNKNKNMNMNTGMKPTPPVRPETLALNLPISPLTTSTTTTTTTINNTKTNTNGATTNMSAVAAAINKSIPMTSPNTDSPSDTSTLLKRGFPGFNGISLLHGHYNNNNNHSNTNSPKLSRVRMSSKFGRVRKRVVFKNGECNLHQTNISKRRRRYLADIFTTLVDIQWRWTLLIFTLSFLLSWLSFAMVWWLIALTHGDLEIEHLPDRQEESNWKPCVGNFMGFTSAFLFSIETQHTIGYGSRYTTEECPEAVFVMCMQSILGVMIQAFMVGVVFAKMSRPKKRTQTLLFSRNGVICQRDGHLCLMFRVGDMRRSHIISANVRAQLIKRRVTAEGEILPFYQHELKVGVDCDQSDIFFIWPMIVVHRIDKDSPLYATSAEELLREKFEIVLILEGVIESTGATTQARTSYLPSELLWGHRFESLVGFRKDVGEYTVDYSSFNNTYEVETPLCSARDLDEIKKIQDDVKQKGLRLLTPFRISSLSSSDSTPGQ